MANLQEHVSLRDWCRFQTGGAADYFVVTTSLKEIVSAINQAKKLGIPWRVIGQGTSILVSDSGYPGVIIKNNSQNILFVHDQSQVIVEAGTPLQLLFTQALSHSYSSLEFLTQTPGTIGGAVYNNLSMFGYEISEYIRSATLLLPNNDRPIQKVDRSWFEFSMHMSKLKRMSTSSPFSSLPVIISVTLQLSKMNYASCLNRVRMFQSLLKKFPIPVAPSLQIFDCLTSNESSKLLSHSKQSAQPLYRLDKTKMKHIQLHDVTVFFDNPNYFINTGRATSREVAQLIGQIQSLIKEEYNSDITPTVEHLGYWD